jgi:copper resistance protein C
VRRAKVEDGRVFMESESKRRVVRITVWVAVLGLLLGVLASIISATSAEAHAALKSVSPKDGSTVASPPTAVVLLFNERIDSSFVTVTVTGPGGASVSEGKPQVEGDTVTQPLATELGNGAYTVVFRVVSEDGHPVSDRTRFVVRAAATPSTTSSPSPSASTSTTGPSPATTGVPTPGETAAAATSSGADGGTPLRVGLAVGVAALALAAGTAFVALTRRKASS